MMPSLLLAPLVEQLAGISVDFTLAFVFVYLYFANAGKPDIRSFYIWPMLGHTVHLLFTILPLVFANFHTGYTSWYNSFFLEAAIFTSALIQSGAWVIFSGPNPTQPTEPLTQTQPNPNVPQNNLGSDPR